MSRRRRDFPEELDFDSADEVDVAYYPTTDEIIDACSSLGFEIHQERAMELRVDNDNLRHPLSAEAIADNEHYLRGLDLLPGPWGCMGLFSGLTALSDPDNDAVADLVADQAEDLPFIQVQEEDPRTLLELVGVEHLDDIMVDGLGGDN